MSKAAQRLKLPFVAGISLKGVAAEFGADHNKLAIVGISISEGLITAGVVVPAGTTTEIMVSDGAIKTTDICHLKESALAVSHLSGLNMGYSSYGAKPR